MERSLLYLGVLTSGVLLGVFFLKAQPAFSGEAKPTWKAEWERTLAAVRKEGRLDIYLSSSLNPVVKQFNKAYPQIKTVTRMSMWFQEAQRVMTERRAGKYLLDLFTTGPTTLYQVFYQAKVLDPIPPTLILPEVKDRSKWFEGKHSYVDSEGKFIFSFEGTAQDYVHYNVNLVKRGEITSYRNLLKPKWRGELVVEDPMIPGIVSHGTRFMYNNPELGPSYLTRLFSETNIRVTRDRRQRLDWLANGKYSVCLFCYGVRTAKAQGLPVDTVRPYGLEEGASIVPILGNIVLLNRAPHPNAAKVFINWFLSREGQMAYQKSRLLARPGADSLRIDIPKDDVPIENRRKLGGKYLRSVRPEWMDLTPARKVIKRAMSQAQRR